MAGVGSTPSVVRAFVERVFTAEALLTVVGKVVAILLIWIGAKVLLKVSGVFVDRLFARMEQEKHFRMEERRSRTLTTLIKSIIRYAIYFFAAVMTLQHVGFNTTSILTAAGIGGLAIGFGAQNLVRDVITGFFILFEDQYGVGDYVTAGGVSGIVEEMGIRITKIRDFGGELHIVPNGEITKVTNFMGRSMRVMFDIGISYESDVDQAIQVLNELFDEFKRSNTKVVEGPSVLGVQDLTDSSINIRILARTLPMEQWAVERELKKQIKRRLDEVGIQVPFPHRLLLIRNVDGGPDEGALEAFTRLPIDREIEAGPGSGSGSGSGQGQQAKSDSSPRA